MVGTTQTRSTPKNWLTSSLSPVGEWFEGRQWVWAGVEKAHGEPGEMCSKLRDWFSRIDGLSIWLSQSVYTNCAHHIQHTLFSPYAQSSLITNLCCNFAHLKVRYQLILCAEQIVNLIFNTLHSSLIPWITTTATTWSYCIIANAPLSKHYASYLCICMLIVMLRPYASFWCVAWIVLSR